MQAAFEPVRTVPNVLHSAWNPTSNARGQLATVSVTKDSTSLTIVDVNSSSESKLELRGSIDLKNNLPNVISWGKSAVSARGLIACGFKDGNLDIYRPTNDAKIVPATRVLKSKQAVRCIDFCNIGNSSSLVAFGCDKNELHISDLKNPQSPNVFSLGGTSPNVQQPKVVSKCNSLAWNTQVMHIVGSASSDGSVSVWDLRQKKAWCKFSPSAGVGVSVLEWNPAQGLHLLTALDSVNKPKLQLWDLRKGHKSPIVEFSENSKPLTSVSWSRWDPMFFATASKDGEMLIWDLQQQKAVANLNGVIASRTIAESIGQHDDPFDFNNESAGDIFNTTPDVAPTATEVNVAYPCVAFSTSWRNVLYSKDAENELKVFNCASLRQCTAEDGVYSTPRWISRQPKVKFGFGDRLISVASVQEKKPTSVELAVSYHFSDDEFVNKAVEFEQSFSQSPEEEGSSLDPLDNLTDTDKKFSQLPWANLDMFAKCLASDFTEILEYLKIDEAAIAAELEELSLEPGSPTSSTKEILVASAETKAGIEKAILLGKTELAVELMLKAKQYADAFLLSASISNELYEKCVAEYLANKSIQDAGYSSFMKGLALSDLGLACEPGNQKLDFKKTISYFAKYAESPEEFSKLCEKLGDALADQPDNIIFSYCLALNTTKLVDSLKGNLHDELFTQSLFSVFKFLMIFQRKISPTTFTMDDGFSAIIVAVSKILSSSGQMEYAATFLNEYIKNSAAKSSNALELANALYLSQDNPAQGIGNFIDFVPNPLAQFKQATYEVFEENVFNESPVQEEESFSEKENTSTAPINQTPVPKPARQQPQTSFGKSSAQDFHPTPMPARPQINPNNPPGTSFSNGQSVKKASPRIPVNDGFGTTAGNPVAGRKYGNISNVANHFPQPSFENAPEGSAITNHVTSAPEVSKPEPVSIPLSSEARKTIETFNALADALKGSEGLTPTQSRVIANGVKSLTILSNSIEQGKVGPGIVDELHKLAAAVTAYDFATAGQLKLTLTRTFWGKQKAWLKGFAQLISLAETAYAE